MANKDFELLLKMRADFAQANREFDAARKKLSDVTAGIGAANKASASFKGVLVGVGAAIAGAGAVAGGLMATYISNTIEAEKVQAQLLARIKDTGAAAGRTLDQLNAQADQLQKLTIFDDEAIGGAQAMLLTFKEIQGLQFDRAVEATLDLSTAMGTDLNSAALQLGKALNDPIAGLSALGRAGVQFSDAQKDVIKGLVETGEIAKAQELILGELESQMGTAAEAARDTLGGALTALKNSFDNLLEGESGSEGVRGTREAIESLTDTLNDPDTKRGVDATAEGLLTIANAAIQLIAKLGEAGSALKEFYADDEEKSDASLLNKRNELEDQLFRSQRMAKGGGFSNLLIGTGLVDDPAEIQAQIDEIDRIQSARNRAGMFDGVSVKVDSTAGGKRGARTSSKKDGKKTDPDDPAKRRLAGLKEELALLGELKDGEEKASEAAKIRYAITDGELKNANPALKQQLLDQATALDLKRADIAAEEARKKKLEETRDAYKDLVEELRTPAEAALETAIEQVNTLNAALQAGVAGAEAYDQQLGRIVGEAFDKAPKFGGLAPEIGGPFGELGKIGDASAELDKWYQDQLARLNAFRAQKIGVEANWNAQEQQLNVQHQEAMQKIESARQQALLAGAASTLGEVADIWKAYGGEQSSTYRALFALSKGFAVAQAAVALAQNVAEASKVGFPQNIGLIAGALAQGAQIAALLSQASYSPEGFATGGRITGPGTGTSDSIPIWASKDEFMTRAAVVRQPGALSFLEDFNERGMDALYGWRGYADGGRIEAPASVGAPRWDHIATASSGGANVQNRMRIYLLNNEDELAQRLASHPAMEKAVVAISGQNGNAIRADW